jgi:hypothetical protein
MVFASLVFHLGKSDALSVQGQDFFNRLGHIKACRTMGALIDDLHMNTPHHKLLEIINEGFFNNQPFGFLRGATIPLKFIGRKIFKGRWGTWNLTSPTPLSQRVRVNPPWS